MSCYPYLLNTEGLAHASAGFRPIVLFCNVLHTSAVNFSNVPVDWEAIAWIYNTMHNEMAFVIDTVSLACPPFGSVRTASTARTEVERGAGGDWERLLTRFLLIK